MTRRFAIALALPLMGLAAFSYSHRASAQGAGGWITLLDGKSLDNFDQIGTANWRIEDGAAVADKGNGFLVSKKSFKNYELRVEFFISEDANSGVFVHCVDPKSVTGKSAYEVNLWDTRPQKDYATGAIVGIAKVEPMPHVAGKWSTYDITVKDGVFTVVLNGQKTVDGAKDKDAKFPEGRIALQHGDGLKDAKGVVNDKGVVKFRKVEIKPL
jgi:hypothetical protein